MSDILTSRVEDILQEKPVKPRSRVEELLRELIGGGIGGSDVFVDSGELKYVVVDGSPYVGAVTGDPYLDLRLNNEEQTHVYIPVKDLLNLTKRATVTLTAAGWSNRQQTANVSGVLADETKQLIQIVPASVSRTTYEECGVKCVGQGAGTLTFSCESVPENALTVYVCITGVSG